MAKLDELRAQLDALDRTIVETVAARQRVIEEVTKLKAAAGELLLRDAQREEQILARLAGLAQQLGVSGAYVRRLFREVLDYSLRSQQRYLLEQNNPGRLHGQLVVAYQGAAGAYSHIAAEEHFAAHRDGLECRGYPSFAAMLQAVTNRDADYGMLPVENTTAGSVSEAYDLLQTTSLSFVGEELLRVEHCLIGLHDAEVDHIRRVYSHPHALPQCSQFLAGLRDCAVESFTDTAMSVKKVRDEKDASQAAIGSERAAALYGLKVLARNIANQRDNFTRFMVVAREPLQLDERMVCKTSLIFSTRHEQGALVRCLNVLSDAGLNLTKLESRPRPSSPFEYVFYVDFEGNLETAEVQAALAAMRGHTSTLKVLGCYPAHALR
jgi:chorismate mutase / prephenate dehydratase